MKVNRLQPSAATPARSARTLAVAPFEGFDRQNCLAVQQEIIDDQLADLTEGELKLMLMVTRATNGGQREAVPLSVRVLCEGGAPDVLPARGSGTLTPYGPGGVLRAGGSRFPARAPACRAGRKRTTVAVHTATHRPRLARSR